MSRVLIPLTEGFEESEAIVPADLLVRAEIEAVFVGMTGSSVTGSHGITVSCNGGAWGDLNPNPDDYIAVFLPGGRKRGDAPVWGVPLSPVSEGHSVKWTWLKMWSSQ